ncbi:MAG: hypothetical protein QG594_749 [Bacteroidota bacterium]|nr:hypothetical protein [Bacteroidota bacterium]
MYTPPPIPSASNELPILTDAELQALIAQNSNQPDKFIDMQQFDALKSGDKLKFVWHSEEFELMVLKIDYKGLLCSGPQKSIWFTKKDQREIIYKNLKKLKQNKQHDLYDVPNFFNEDL